MPHKKGWKNWTNHSIWGNFRLTKKLCPSVAYVDRFNSYCNKGTRDLGGVLQVLQIKILEEVTIKLVQQDLKEEFDLLTNEKYIYIWKTEKVKSNH